jgi:ribonucleoside-triphosphate reductase
VTDKKCKAPTEVYQRVTGFFRPVQTYNKGKAEEYRERVNYKPETRYHPNHGG